MGGGLGAGRRALTYLLDTNVFSELRKRSPDRNVAAWFEARHGEELFTSVLVLGELRKGAELLGQRDSRRAEALSAWLDAFRRDFGERILAVSAEVADEWGRLNARRPLLAVDGLLGATAVVHGLTLVTRDAAGLREAGVGLLDPWRAGARRRR